MTKGELLIIHLIEECSEVQKRATKYLRFGSGEMQEGQGQTNKSRLEDEIVDLLPLIDILQEEELISIPVLEVPYNLTRKKREKVKRYLQYSRELGIFS